MVLRMIAALFVALCLQSLVHAQQAEYPSQPIHIIVPAAPGGVSDLVARAVAQHLTQVWGSQVIVENRAGASNQIAAEFVAKSAPDGHTLLLTAEATLVINPYLYRSLRYDAVKDFTPISGLVAINHALIVSNKLGVTTLDQLLALAKQKTGTIAFAGYGIGSTGHLNMELLQHAAHVKFVAVQYKGAAPALTDVMGGHVDAMFISASSSIRPDQSGSVKLIAFGSKERMPAHPNVPTIAETLPGFEARSWFGLIGPKGMPKPIVDKLNAAIAELFKSDDFKERFLKPNLYTPIVSSPDDFAKFIAAERRKWEEVVKIANVKLD